MDQNRVCPRSEGVYWKAAPERGPDSSASCRAYEILR